jgi:hypothetical protein
MSRRTYLLALQEVPVEQHEPKRGSPTNEAVESGEKPEL